MVLAFREVCEKLELNHKHIGFELLDNPDFKIPGFFEPAAYRDGFTQTIQVSSKLAFFPLILTGVLAHKLCYAKLKRETELKARGHDHEGLTDLATIFFGYGISTYRIADEELAEGGIGRVLNHRGRGYMSQPEVASALAMICALRGVARPKWTLREGKGFKSEFRPLVDFWFQADGLALQFDEHDQIVVSKRGSRRYLELELREAVRREQFEEAARIQKEL